MRNLSLVVLALLLFTVSLNSVRAENVSVSIAQYSVRTPVALYRCCSANANLTVVYNGSDHLVVGIKDSSSGNYLQGRLVLNYPYANIQQTSCHGLYAIETLCNILTRLDSGTLHLGFDFTGPNRTGNWNLEAVAMLADSNFNPINSTVSVSPFTIIVYDMANVYVNAPASIGLKLDGVSEEPGSFQVALMVGSNHTFSVPLIQVTNSTSRLVLSWFGGYGASYVTPPFAHNDSGSVNVSMHVLQDTNLTADYVKEYKVAVITGSYNVTLTSIGPQWQPSNWYQQGTLAYVWTAPSPKPMPGIIGLLEGKEVLDGWYVNGEFLNNLIYASIPVSGPLTIEARWHDDYTIPITLTSILAIAVCVLFLVTRTRRRDPTKTTI
ncbi:MAG TPA: hypothetical protein VJZ32_06305 [Candidatus Bathyarchaeia archaeon]|nr:hypothetical protein [Candidatus Bathyarchaeia archaeon]